MKIDNVEVKASKDFGEGELRYYVQLVKSKFPDDEITKLEVGHVAGEDRVALHYEKRGKRFERVRRITGYLTGDLNTWNNAKRAEESERVKHDVEI